MTQRQTALYWRKWGAAVSAQGWGALKAAERDRQRHAAHVAALRHDVSATSISNTQLSAVLWVFEALAAGATLAELAANSRGDERAERDELCVVITRMAEYLVMLNEQRRMAPVEARERANAYAQRIARDALATTGDWRELPVRLRGTRKDFDRRHQGEAYQPPRGVWGRFDLENLRNIISSRLNQKLTKLKDYYADLLGHHRNSSNRDIIGDVKRRGAPCLQPENQPMKINPELQPV
jgi:hypothetical protein